MDMNFIKDELLEVLEEFYYSYQTTLNRTTATGSVDNNKHELDINHKKHRDKLENHWKINLRDKLKKFAYVKFLN